jgi:hypothetical protein
MPSDDDQTAYSGEPLPPRRVPRYDDRREIAPPPRRRHRDYDDFDDDERLPRRSRRRDREREEASGVVTSLGTVGIVFGMLHLVGALGLCLTGTVFAGMFVGMGHAIADAPQGRGQPPPPQEVVDVCNGVGFFTLLVTVAPALMYAVAAVGLTAGGWGVIKRREWARILMLIVAPVVLLLDFGSVFLNPLSGAIAVALALGYGIFAYIVLLHPENIEEFA